MPMNRIGPYAGCLASARAFTRQACLVLVGAAIGLLAGCGRNAGPVVQFVEGKVILDGEALEGATVGLSPVKGSTGLPAYASTNGQGIFRVTSTRGGRRDGGAVAGEYVVTISKVVSEDEDSAVEEDGPSKKPARRPSTKPPRNLVPDVYAEVDTSPLRATIQRGANTGSAFVFDLKSPGPNATSGKR